MKCDEFEAHLNEILDERRRPEWDERLRLHGELCAGCRQLAAAYGVLFEGLFALPVPQAPADLGARVLDDIGDIRSGELDDHDSEFDDSDVEELEVRPRLSRSAALAMAVFSTAAAVVVAVSLSRGSKSEPQVAQVAPTPNVATGNVAIGAMKKGPRIEDIHLDLEKWQNVPLIGPALISMSDDDPNTDPYAEMAKETGRGLASVVLRMPRLAGPEGVRPPDPNGLGVWPLHVSEELRPVTESMTETFNLLLDTLPLTFWSQTRTRAS